MIRRHISWLFTMIMIVVDVLLIITGFNIAWWLRYVAGVGGVVGEVFYVPLGSYSAIRMTFVGVVLLVFAVSGIYRVPRGRRLFVEMAQIVQAMLVALGLLVIALFIIRLPFSSRLMLGYAGGVVVLLLMLSRLLVRLLKQTLWQRGIGVSRVLVVGDGAAARDIMSDLLQHQNTGRQLWGCLTAGSNHPDGAIVVDARRPIIVPVCGSVNELDAVMLAHSIRHVVIALPGTAAEATRQAIETCIHRHVDFRLAPELFGVGAHRVTVDDTYERPVLNMVAVSHYSRRRVIKRLLDITLSLLVLMPFGLLLTLMIAVLVKLDSPGPVFFRQKRMTLDGSLFWVYKFRSMRVDAENQMAQLRAVNEAEGPIFKMRNDPRITRVGKWLRRTSMDELPQIFNILLGEMSWVGPRPPLPSEVEQYRDWQKRRLGTITGLTGLWQVSGRSLLSFEEMVKLDLYYIENWSIWLDLKILLMTIPAVLKTKGAY